MEGRSSKRRCASRRSDTVPSEVHYVGYVEDDETPQSIARKFEELERIQAAGRSAAAQPAQPAGPDAALDTAAAAAAAGSSPAGLAPLDAAAADGAGAPDAQPDAAVPVAAEGLTDEQLMEVFKQTSIFTVRSAADGNAALMSARAAGWDEGQGGGYHSGDELLASDDEDDIEALRGFWSDADDTDSSEHWRKLKKLRRKRHSGTGLVRAPRERGVSHAKPRHDIVTHYNAATQALIRRKVRPYDADAIMRIQMPPPPLPFSWGRTVQAYVPAELRSQPAAEAMDDDSGAEAAQGPFDRTYQAVLVQPGWVLPEAEAAAASDAHKVAALAAVPLERLCPVGFVFVWADKAHLHAVVKLLYARKFVYVENLTWVHMGPDNRALALDAPHSRASHSTLLMFRKDGLGKDIELRHQRKPDVLFDCIRSTPEGGRHMPEEAYIALETLLPTGKGSFLELWSASDTPRDGWIQVVDVPVCL